MHNLFRYRAMTGASWLAVAAFALPAVAQAQSAILLPPLSVPADTLGNGAAVEDIPARRSTTSDTAALLTGIPGVGLASGGGVSSLPVIHGMADDRNRVLVDGMTILSACPNHMNPAMSYMDPAQVDSMDVTAGITPVSLGGDSIGGTVSVRSAPPIFATSGEALYTGGSLSTFFRSNDRAIGGSVAAEAATQDVSLAYTGAAVRARDYHDGDGDRIASTLYASENHAARLAVRHDAALLTLQGGQQFIPYEGFPNQRMDLTSNHGRFLNAAYTDEFDWGLVEARAYWQNTKHAMNFLSEKGGANPGMPMNTDGTDMGYSVKAAVTLSPTDTLTIGNELHRFRLNDWWPPTSATPNGMMSPNTFLNINEGRRDDLGTYAEWESKWSPHWTTLLGARNDTVWMDTGDVQGYSNNMMAHYGIDAAAFNAQDHARTDVNLDLTALARYEPNAMNTEEIGYARKTRSPNLYERYAWSTGAMASSMVNWFGDANGYVGNLALKPEIANTISASTGWHDDGRKNWEVKITPYYTYVQDYINVDSLGLVTVRSSPVPFALLRFANHDAQLYGVDLSGSLGLWDSSEYGRVRLKGVVGWVRGQQINNGDNLYHLTPLNGLLTLQHDIGRWVSAIDLQMVDTKAFVDPLREEPMTPGYAVVNLRTGYRWDNIQVTLEIDNLFDKQYYLPLGGVDFGDWKQADFRGPLGPLPAPGRSVNAGMTVTF